MMDREDRDIARNRDEERRGASRREQRDSPPPPPSSLRESEQRTRRDSRDRERHHVRRDSRDRRRGSERYEEDDSRRRRSRDYNDHHRRRHRREHDDDRDRDRERDRSRERTGTTRRRDKHADEDDDREDGGRRRHHRRRREPDGRSRSPPARRQRRSPRSRSRTPPGKKARRSRSYDSNDDASRSPPPRRSRRHDEDDESPKPPPPPSALVRSRAPLPSQNDSFRGDLNLPASASGAPPLPEKQKPNYKPTGLLAKEANTVQHAPSSTTTSAATQKSKTILKYHEPPEARLPSATTAPWRMYIFPAPTDDDSSTGKGEPALPETLPLHTRSCWLFGRDAGVADVHCAHASVSKQHAVVQFRRVTTTSSAGEGLNAGKATVKPYVIDLESAQGTFLNGEKVQTSRFVELRDRDVLRFGASRGEFMVMLPPGE